MSAPMELRGADPVRCAWPEVQALAAALGNRTYEIAAPEYFCPDCVRRQPLPGYCGTCRIIRGAFPPPVRLGIVTGPA